MNIYLFSCHTPDSKMLQDLGGSITTQFKGCVGDVIARDDQISFTETLHIGGETCEACHTIPTDSIVVSDDAPLALQEAWLKAGVAILLIPQTKQEVKDWGHHVSKYEGLTQVHKIEVVTSSWSRKESEKADEPSIQNPESTQPTRTASMFQVLNLFRRQSWKPTIPSINVSLIVGFILGAYSSIFLASPLLAWWRSRSIPRLLRS